MTQELIKLVELAETSEILGRVRERIWLLETLQKMAEKCSSAQKLVGLIAKAINERTDA